MSEKPLPDPEPSTRAPGLILPRQAPANHSTPRSGPVDPFGSTIPPNSQLPQLNGGDGADAESILELGNYRIIRELGRGGMGIVYEAVDVKRGMRVALKTLPRLGDSSLLRFKREFRSLSDLHHPNLVTFYDLVSQGNQWFFTMERIEGRPFHEAVIRRPESPIFADRVDLQLFRDCLGQLALGVHALHERGKLHRDLKPSNVLVTKEGRVVILDMGLAADLDTQGQHANSEQQIVGTLAYLAPEQASLGAIGPAADWYSVGVIMFQILTGHLPFDGSALMVLAAKQGREAPAVAMIVPDAPADLIEICQEMLAREPESRPSGEEILNQLAGGASPSPRAEQASATSRAPFVGRAAEQEALRSAFELTKKGCASVALIVGESGVGKSFLARHFLERLEREGAVVLRSRCYDREAVPFKALDGAIDELSRYLRKLPVEQVQALLPRDVTAVRKMFRVLEEVPALAWAPGRPLDTTDAAELRRRAFAGLRELLARLADRGPLILAMDDLQWGDADSAALLEELLQPPGEPAMFIMACARDATDERATCLRALRSPRLAASASVSRRIITLSALSASEAKALARSLLAGAHADAMAEQIAGEAGGIPFFVQELARNAASVGDSSQAPATLDDYVWQRIGQLSTNERSFLEIVTIAGVAVRSDDIREVAGLPENDPAIPTRLRQEHLIRAQAGADQDRLEPYHDRIREVLLSRIDPRRLREIHGRIGEVLERLPGADPDLLAHHFSEAGQMEKAAKLYASAGRLAYDRLAYERAASHFEQAIRLGSWAMHEECQLEELRGQAWSQAGKGPRAAEAFLKAAALSEGKPDRVLRRKAGMELLISGRIDEGLAIFRRLLNELKIPYPETPLRAVARIIRLHAWWWLFGFRLRKSKPEDREAAAERIALTWSLSLGLFTVDYIRGAAFTAESLHESLRAGNAQEATKALQLEQLHLTALEAPERISGHARRMSEMLRQHEDPFCDSLRTLSQGMIAFGIGQWAKSEQYCHQAAQAIEPIHPEARWAISTGQSFSLWSLHHLGLLATLRERMVEPMKQAAAAGDLLAYSNHATFNMPQLLLADDKPEDVEPFLKEVLGGWSQSGFHVQHNNALEQQICAKMYQGKAGEAFDYYLKEYHRFRQSMLERAGILRIYVTYLLARCACAAIQESKSPSDAPLATVHRGIKLLKKEKAQWAKPCAESLIAVRYWLCERNEEAAIASLRQTIKQFTEVDMGLHVAAHQWRLGELLGGVEGADLISKAGDWMRLQGIKRPSRFVAVYAPGYPERAGE